jgi:NADH:ubiquinone oxidoreductase subunit 3 (subunit A)
MWRSILLVFVASLIVSLIFFWIGSRISPKGLKTPGKLAPYACGEDVPVMQLQVNVERYFIYAVYFLVFDALAFLLALSFSTPGFYPILFAIVVLLAVAVLRPLR